MKVGGLKLTLIEMGVEKENQNLPEQVFGYFIQPRQQQEWWDRLSDGEKAFVERSARRLMKGR